MVLVGWCHRLALWLAHQGFTVCVISATWFILRRMRCLVCGSMFAKVLLKNLEGSCPLSIVQNLAAVVQKVIATQHLLLET